MITQKIIKKVEEFVYEQGVPPKFHVELSNEKGQWLAKKLKANKDVVLLGTLLMDCQLGKAISEGRQKDHVAMSAKKAEELLSKFKEITKEERQNVLQCVRQHHGVKKFYSLEAEICCNADCYRFASVRGVVGGIKHLRDMPLEDLVNLLSAKANEKWKALTLDICKKELTPQYKAIKNFLSKYES